MLYIVLAYLMLFAALTNSVCLNNASFFFLFKYFLCQGYELSGEIALKNNHYYYYYYYLRFSRLAIYCSRNYNQFSRDDVCCFAIWHLVVVLSSVYRLYILEVTLFLTELYILLVLSFFHHCFEGHIVC